MKLFSIQNLIKLAGCALIAMQLSSMASASCGDSFVAMATGKAIAPSFVGKQSMESLDGAGHSSIVGLWHVQFLAGGTPIQEAFQNWNLGGTEVHNPNVDPRAGNVCLGTWIKTPGGVYKLAHRVWNYDTTGDFMGVIYVSESVTLSQHGNAMTGSVTLTFYDPDGNFVTEVGADVAGTRIQAE